MNKKKDKLIRKLMVVRALRTEYLGKGVNWNASLLTLINKHKNQV